MFPAVVIDVFSRRVFGWSMAGVRLSVGSVGDCYDNAMCERFFASLECELLDRYPFRNHREARRALFPYLEGCYNPHLRHSGIDYLSPVACENKYKFFFFPEDESPYFRLNSPDIKILDATDKKKVHRLPLRGAGYLRILPYPPSNRQ